MNHRSLKTSDVRRFLADRSAFHVPALLLVLIWLGGCCSPNAQAVSLSKSVMENAKLLSEEHGKSLQAFKAFTKDAERAQGLVMEAAQAQSKARETAERKYLAERLRTAQYKALNDYDSQAMLYLTTKFDQAMQEKYWKPINKQLEIVESKYKTLLADAGDQPTPDELDELNSLKLTYQDYRRRGWEGDVRVRRLVLKRFNEQRQALIADILVLTQNAFEEETESVTPESGPASDAAAEAAAESKSAMELLRTNIDEREKELIRLGATQDMALHELHRYITRPSEFELILQGVKIQTKAEIGEVSGLLSDHAGKLIDKASAKGTAFIDKVIADISDKVRESTQKLSEFADKTASEQSDTVTEE
ncbi:MAG: hypothetical protein KTR15_09195 [Phycisphaeraceae bacterium]|nr:hypothetical protein [Phycisphaeraceae bacterium]